MTTAQTRARPVIVAQFSDLHVMEEGARNRHGIDPAPGLMHCIASLNALQAPPDLLVLSGDLVNEGNEAEYRRLRGLLAGLRVPLCLMPGNHDRRRPLRRVFAEHDYLGRSGRIHYYRDVRGLRLIALDTVVEGEDAGDLDDAQLQWLDSLLRAAPQQPALVFMHHPPVSTGFSQMDRISLAPASAARLGSIIASHPQVRALLCGHVHRDVQSVWQGALVSVCPSTAFQAQLRFGRGKFEASHSEPPAYRLHHWDGAALVSHTVAVPPAAG